MRPIRRPAAALLSLALAAALAACQSAASPTPPGTSPGASPAASATPAAATRPAGWGAATHGEDAAPDAARAFPTDKRNALGVTIAAADWQKMLDDMAKLYGPRGTGGLDPDGTNPMWAPATVTLDGVTWTHVGVRFRGGDALEAAWKSGSDKLPLRLDFDQFEDDFPEIDNQRFYGFKQVDLDVNAGDASGIRDVLAVEAMKAMKVIAPQAGFYRVSLDRGAGVADLGAYTASEVIDDTLVGRTFAGEDGNLYEPDGKGASFAAATHADLQKDMKKLKNASAKDWTDVEKLYAALQAPNRKTDAAAWRSGVEAALDVDTFLRWLATGAILRQGDTYGSTGHNYYVYDHAGKLVWLADDAGRGLNTPVSDSQPAVSIDKAEVTDAWPLIRFLLDDATYMAKYKGFLREAAGGFFAPASLDAKAAAWTALSGGTAAAAKQVTDAARARAAEAAAFAAK